VSAGRRSARRQAAFILYQQDLLRLDATAALGRLEFGEVSDYARRIVNGVGEERERIDLLLREHLSGWSLERLGLMERAILSVAAYELVREVDVPMAVVVDEAVSLAKRFCSGVAGALVNGILGGVAAATRPGGVESKGESENAE
jgi:N utilization substance protein B